jgi:DMSO/TMAO reductase YedYZ molybdopterin-dependent catalytic subunit
MGNLSRRAWFTTLVKGMGAGIVLGHRASADAVAQQAEAAASGPLTVRVTRPFDAETPVREFASWLTPNERFFVRSHFGPPPAEALQPDAWRLAVKGLVKEGLSLTLKDLQQFEPVSLTAVLQCSGNGRAHHRPKVPGVQWERGAVGNAQAAQAGAEELDELADDAVRPQHLRQREHEVGGRGTGRQFAARPDTKDDGLGQEHRPALPTVPLFTRSIPLAKALHPDTLLAYEMNGRPLPLLHGAPLRVITPGWMAESCMKWLTEVTVRAEEAPGYYMQQAYRMPETSIQPGSGLPGSVMVPVEQMPVKSLIAAPGEGDTLKTGPVTKEWRGPVNRPWRRWKSLAMTEQPGNWLACLARNSPMPGGTGNMSGMPKKSGLPRLCAGPRMREETNSRQPALGIQAGSCGADGID